MKKIIRKINGVVQVILLAPVKLPAKVLNIMKYIGLGLGIIESVIVENDDTKEVNEEAAEAKLVKLNTEAKNIQPEAQAKLAEPNVETSVSEQKADQVLACKNRPNRLIKYDLETGKEVVDETE